MKDQLKLPFRPDIEGLRAIAILLVLASHAKFPGFAGGFVGVDLFFVISGYLITGLLLAEIRSSGSIDLAGFFARRIRRLLPALLVTIFGTGVVAIAFLTPSEQLDQISAAMAASLWVSNIYFAFLKMDYFGASASNNLFLHTWSLGVEEQFYLVWPVLMLLFFWLARYLRNSWQRALGYGLGACFVFSFVFSYGLLSSDPGWSFYLMPLRGWQFALGALCVFVHVVNRRNGGGFGRWFVFVPSARDSLVAGWCGLLLILGSAMMLDGSVPYPGVRALAPSIGAALVLLSGTAGYHHGVARLLSQSHLLWIGRRSYSLYLWHWPVLLLGGSLFAPGQLFSSLLLLVVSFCLAIVTFHFVESPVRYSRFLSSRPRWSIWGGLFMMLSAVGSSVLWLGAANSWLAVPEQERHRDARFDLPRIYAMGCDDWFHSSSLNICQFGNKDAQHTVVLLGDSIGAQWFPALSKIYGGADWRLLVMTKSACPFVDEIVFYPRIGREYVECEIWRGQVAKTITDLKPDLVFIGSAGSYGFTEAQWTMGTRRLLEELSGVAKRIYLIQPTPIIPFDGPHCLGRQAWRARFLPISNECVVTVEGGGALKSWLTAAANAFDNVSVLDMSPVVCPDQRCAAEQRSSVVFRDDRHLTAQYVLSISDDFLSRVSAISVP